MKVELEVLYPAVNRVWPNPSVSERRFSVVLDVRCSTWKTNTAIRKGFCDLLFAGCGNDPGLSDLVHYESHDPNFRPPFLSNDPGITKVHYQWATQRTRSMSVGDVVIIKELNEAWVCDSCGWALLTPEQAESWLKYPRKYGCCSFELSEWMKNETGVSL